MIVLVSEPEPATKEDDASPHCDLISQYFRAEDSIKKGYFGGEKSENWSIFETRESLSIRAKDKINKELPLNTLNAKPCIT